MATTKFKGPINSIDGFQFNGLARTLANTRVVTTEGKGSKVMLASVAGLSTVEYGWAQQANHVAGGTKLICCIETSKNGVVGSSASFQLDYKNSTDSTMSSAAAIMGAATIDCFLLGAG